VVTISGNFGFAHTLERHCQRAYPAIRLTLIAAIDVPGVAGESAFDGAGDPRENTNVLSGLAGATAAAKQHQQPTETADPAEALSNKLKFLAKQEPELRGFQGAGK